MTESQNKPVVRSLLALLVFAALFSGGLAWLEQQTAERIEQNQTLRATRMIEDVLPAAGYDNQPQLDQTFIRDTDLTGTAGPLPVYRARLDGRPVALAMTVVASDGYVGPIKLLVGIDTEGRIIRARVTDHRETPGLGDRIEAKRSDWIHQFEGKTFTPSSAWAPRPDGGTLDAITGATITSRAVSRALRRSLEYFETHETELFAPQN